MKRSGQIAIASATATGINNDAHVLVPRENNITKYYPAVSNDDALVVYNQSTCGVDPDVYTNLADGRRRLRRADLRRLRRLVGDVVARPSPTGRAPRAPRQRQRRSRRHLRQLVAALEPGQRHVPRHEAVLAGVLVAATRTACR